MYLEHFGLRECPFGIDNDPRFTYFGEQHREAISSLYVSILEGRGISAVIALPGMGKTTLVNYLLLRVQERATICRLEYPYRRRVDLMGGILSGLGLDAGEERDYQQIQQLERFCVQQANLGRKTVLFVDEAQALSVESMEQLRLISNLRHRGKPINEILLAGHPSLAHAIRFPELQALRQRIGVMTHIKPFDEGGVRKYVAHRLQVAGRSEPVFRSDALEVAAYLSQGIPRNINHLCHNAMMLACAEEESRVSEESVWEAGEEMRLDIEFAQQEPTRPYAQSTPEAALVSGLGQLPFALRRRPVLPSERVAAGMARRAALQYDVEAGGGDRPASLEEGAYHGADTATELAVHEQYERPETNEQQQPADFLSGGIPLRERSRPRPSTGRGRFGRRSRH
ncbi:MAG: AAA family ATPase [Bryobacterales bacterium]